MRTLTEFIESNNVLPIIECGIGPASFIAEDVTKNVEQSEHFPLILPDKDAFPSSKKYRYHSNGMWIARDHSHVVYKDQNSSVTVPMEQLHRMYEHITKKIGSWDSDLRKASGRLASEYGQYQTHHIKALQKYAADSSPINHRLTEGEPMEDSHLQMMNHLDEAIHTHSTPHAFTVYSGIGLKHADLVMNNSKVFHPAFLSTSLSPHVAASFTTFTNPEEHEFKGHMLAIQVPYGHPGAYIHHHTMTNEYELVLPRNTTLNIHHDKRSYSPIPLTSGPDTHFYTIHHATIEPNK